MREWLSASDLAGLPGMPSSERGVRKRADRLGWRSQPREGLGGGFEYHLSHLPTTTRAHLAGERAARASSWEDWQRATEKARSEAMDRVAVLADVRRLVEAGATTRTAVAQAAQSHGVSTSSIWQWSHSVRGMDQKNWAPALLPAWRGGGRKVEIPEAAWEEFKGDYLRLARPAAAQVVRRLARKWPNLPDAKTFLRRIEELPREVVVLARDGREALDRTTPPQERDRAVFTAMQAVNVDGHKFDVFVEWPDGEIGRPMMVCWQDLYSGKLLAHRLDKSENAHALRLSFGDVVEKFGIPDHAWLDNGRGNASKWLTGGTPNRFRFKVREEDPAGLLTLLGVKVHWTIPYHGQSKPIERAFRDLCESIARHPRCEGAYTGNNPLAKPENYGTKAVPFEDFRQLVETEIHAHNAQAGRRSEICKGRSFDEVFTSSYQTTTVRKGTQAQRALWLLAAERVPAGREDGSVRLFENRYWSEALAQHAGDEVVVRFDPQNLHGSVLVYTLAGELVGEAPCVQRVGFDDAAAAQEHARLLARRNRDAKRALEAERKLDALEVAARQPQVAPPPVPKPQVVELARVGKAADRQAAERERTESQPESSEQFEEKFNRAWQRLSAARTSALG
jgi:putative transposase